MLGEAPGALEIPLDQHRRNRHGGELIGEVLQRPAPQGWRDDQARDPENEQLADLPPLCRGAVVGRGHRETGVERERRLMRPARHLREVGARPGQEQADRGAGWGGAGGRLGGDRTAVDACEMPALLEVDDVAPDRHLGDAELGGDLGRADAAAQGQLAQQVLMTCARKVRGEVRRGGHRSP